MPEPMPRMKTLLPMPPSCTVRLGSCMSCRRTTPLCFNWSPVIALTDTGTRCSDSSRLVAETTISSRPNGVPSDASSAEVVSWADACAAASASADQIEAESEADFANATECPLVRRAHRVKAANPKGATGRRTCNRGHLFIRRGRCPVLAALSRLASPVGGGSATRCPLRRSRFPELLTIPAREPAERREPEERGHFREIAVRIIEEDCGELASDAGHDLRKRLAFLRKAPVNGAPIDAEVLCDNLDSACPGADKAHHQLSDLYR